MDLLKRYKKQIIIHKDGKIESRDKVLARVERNKRLESKYIFIN